MNELRLYIDEKEADLDTNTRLDNVIVITKDYENVSDPTAIKWDYTKTVSLPATDRNNALFEHIWNFGQGIIGFDPAKRVPFFMTYNGSVILSGYFKMNTVSRKGHYPYQYKCTLYGSLGDFFNALGDKDMDELRVDDGLFRHPITNDRVRDSWPNEYYKYILSYSGFYDNFASDRVITTPPTLEDKGFTHIVTGPNGYFYAIAGNLLGIRSIYVSTDIGLTFDLSALGTGDVRGITYNGSRLAYVINNGSDSSSIYISDNGTSGTEAFRNARIRYYGIKWVYDRFVAHGEYTTGDFIMYYHSTTGNAGVSNWSAASVGNTQFAARFIDVSYVRSGTTTYYFLLGVNGSRSAWTTNHSTFTASNLPASGVSLTSCDGNGSYTAVVGTGGNVWVCDSSRSFSLVQSSTDADLTRVRYLNGSFYAVGENNTVIASLTGAASTWVNISPSANTVPVVLGLQDISYDPQTGRLIAVGANGYMYNDGITPSGWQYVRGEEQDVVDSGEEVDEHQRNEFRSYYQRPVIRFKYLIGQIIADAKEDTGYDVILDESFFNESNPYWWDTWVVMDRLQSYDDDHDGNIRSGDEITFRLMMKKGVSQLSFLTHYTRMFGLKYRIDALEKKVYIMTRNTFFQDYQIEDWSQKMDYNTAVELDVNPIEEKNWLLRWQDAGTYYEEKYNKKYGIDFGAKEIDTGYEFSTKTREWMENNIYTNAIISREHDIYFTDRGGNYWDDKILPAFFVKSNDKRDNTEVNMSLLFFDGMRQTAQPYRLTDDPPEAQQLNLYSWQDVDEGLTVSEYPFMTRLIEKGGDIYSLDIEKPNGYNYPITADEYPEGATIYSRFWRAYIEERINEDRRRMIAKFYLTPIDVAGFEFNKFITINDTLWHVEKINNFSMTSDRSTEVVLYRVNNLESYTEGQRQTEVSIYTLTIIHDPDHANVEFTILN